MMGEGSDCDCAEDWTCLDHRPFAERMSLKISDFKMRRAPVEVVSQSPPREDKMRTSPVTHELHDCHCPAECTTVPPESCTKHPNHECGCTPMVPAASLRASQANERRLIETLRAIVSMGKNPAVLMKMVEYLVTGKEADAVLASRPRDVEAESLFPIHNLAALVDHYRDRHADVLAMDTPWPLRDVLTKFIETVDHLMQDHSCDTHGYEAVYAARDQARRIRAILSGLDT